MNSTTLMLEFDRTEFTALLASLSITTIPGFPDGIASTYLNADSDTLDTGLQRLLDRELVFRTENGISIAEDLLVALVRLTQPTLLMWAITTVEGPQQRLADVVANDSGFTALIPRADHSVAVLLPADRAAAADVLIGFSGVNAETDAHAVDTPIATVSFARAIELVHHALGKPDPISPSQNSTEALLDSTTAFTTYSFWEIGPDGNGSAPREFAVAISGGAAWLLALVDPEAGEMNIGPITQHDLTEIIAGTNA